MSGLPDPAGDKDGPSETDSQMSGSEDHKSSFDKELTKMSKNSHSISKQKKSNKKARNRWKKIRNTVMNVHGWYFLFSILNQNKARNVFIYWYL